MDVHVLLAAKAVPAERTMAIHWQYRGGTTSSWRMGPRWAMNCVGVA